MIDFIEELIGESLGSGITFLANPLLWGMGLWFAIKEDYAYSYLLRKSISISLASVIVLIRLSPLYIENDRVICTFIVGSIFAAVTSATLAYTLSLIIDRLKPSTYVSKKEQDALEQIHNEIRNEKYNHAALTKATLLAKGNTKKERSFYIKLRINQLLPKKYRSINQNYWAELLVLIAVFPYE